MKMTMKPSRAPMDIINPETKRLAFVLETRENQETIK